MDASRGQFLNGFLGAALIAAIPIAAFDVEHRLYAQAMIAAGAFFAGAVSLRFDWACRRIASIRGRIETLESVAEPSEAIVVRVLSTRGDCPLGLQAGQGWSVDAAGRVCPILCPIATDQLSPLFQREECGDRRESQVTCRCPLASGEVAFSVRPAAKAA